MYSVDGTDIILSRGDTGALRIKAKATRKDTHELYSFGERDRAVFSIRASNGQIVKQKAYPLVDNIFVVVFMNADTDMLSPGGYSWDVRYVINPFYQDEPPEGMWPDYSNISFPVSRGQKCMHKGTYYFAKQAIQTSEAWTREHWECADYRIPVDGDQVITPNNPMNMNLLTVVGDI